MHCFLRDEKSKSFYVRDFCFCFFVFLFIFHFFRREGGPGGVRERERGKYVPDLSENCSHQIEPIALIIFLGGREDALHFFFLALV